ncbi:hypothetical protein [Microbacterium sp. NPDC056234]
MAVEGLMIGYLLLGCGIVGAVLATVQAVLAKGRANQDNRPSR